MKLLALALLAGFFGGHTPDASRYSTEGLNLRLVMDAPDEVGHVRGGLVVDLAPGWKTYWSSPGETGIGTAMTFLDGTGVHDLRYELPTPTTFGEGDAAAVGYVRSLVVPIDGVVDAQARRRLVDATIVMGICREVCVPVSARLVVPIPDAPDMEAGDVSDRGRAMLPAPAGPDDPVPVVTPGASGLTIATSGSAVYVSPPTGWETGVAVPAGDGTWQVPVLRSGQGDLATVVVEGPDGAVSHRVVVAR